MANRQTETPSADNSNVTIQTQTLTSLYIPKKNGKLRPLSIPPCTTAMQALTRWPSRPWPRLGQTQLYGFREGRCCADALGHAHTVLSRQYSPQWYWKAISAPASIRSATSAPATCPGDKQILRQWLKPVLEKDNCFRPRRHTARWRHLALLANIGWTECRMPSASGAPAGDKVNFVRYADDFIVTGVTQELLEQKVKPALTAFLALRGLESQSKRPSSPASNRGSIFLGHTVRKFGNKLLIRLQRVAFAPYGQNQALHQLRLGSPQRRSSVNSTPSFGLAYYYRHGVSKRTFARLDAYLFHDCCAGPNDATQQIRRLEATQVLLGSGQNRALQRPALQGEGRHKVLALYRAASTPSDAISKFAGRQSLRSRLHRYFEQRAALLAHGLRRRRPSRRSAVPILGLFAHWLQDAPRAHIMAHRLERLEPYEGTFSTVPRGGRAGNSPLLLVIQSHESEPPAGRRGGGRTPWSCGCAPSSRVAGSARSACVSSMKPLSQAETVSLPGVNWRVWGGEGRIAFGPAMSCKLTHPEPLLKRNRLIPDLTAPTRLVSVLVSPTEV